MNERIRELAGQARAQYCDLGDASCFKRLGLVEAVVFKPENLEKFADMIVKECADIADKAEPYKANDLIRKHFGVKE